MVEERPLSFSECEEFNPDIALHSEEAYREMYPRIAEHLTVECHSVDELLNNLYSIIKHHPPNVGYVFRGNRHSYHTILPTLFRQRYFFRPVINAYAKWKGELTVNEYVGQFRKWESGLIRRFQDAVLIEGHPLSHRYDASLSDKYDDSYKIQQDIYYHARHHEIPTFCVDFTSNFAVAAWFATRKNPAVFETCEDPSEWISIWVFDYDFVVSNLSWCLYIPIKLYHSIPRVKRQYSVLGGDLNPQYCLAETNKFQPLEYKLEQFLATDKMSAIFNGAPKAQRLLSRAVDIGKLNKELRYRNNLSYSYLFPSMLNDIATGVTEEARTIKDKLIESPHIHDMNNGYFHIT